MARGLVKIHVALVTFLGVILYSQLTGLVLEPLPEPEPEPLPEPLPDLELDPLLDPEPLLEPDPLPELDPDGGVQFLVIIPDALGHAKPPFRGGLIVVITCCCVHDDPDLLHTDHDPVS